MLKGVKKHFESYTIQINPKKKITYSFINNQEIYNNLNNIYLNLNDTKPFEYWIINYYLK